MNRASGILLASASLMGCDPFPSFDGYVYCPPNAVYCDGFERNSAQGEWATVTQTGGTLDIVDGTPTGRALHGHVPAGSAFATAELETATMDTRTQVTLHSLVNLGTTLLGTATIHINELGFHAAAGDSFVFPSVSLAGLVIGELLCVQPAGCTYQPSPMPVMVSLTGWHDLSLTVDFQSGTAQVSLEVDGTTVQDHPSPLDIVDGVLAYHAGISSVDPDHDDVDVTVDELVISGE